MISQHQVEVHLLRARGDDVAGLAPLLSADERERAGRFSTPLLRARFICFRGGVRLRLASYLETDPARLRFSYGPQGRPELADDPSLRFNLSHADDDALLAVTRSRAVGVDLERVDPTIDLGAVAAAVFSENERGRLAACAPAMRADFFFRTWVRKEAVIKALGLGFSRDATGLTVEDGPDGPSLRSSIAGEEASRWRIVDLALDSPVFEAMRAALCVERWPDDPAPRVIRAA
jgi:4'-phosphopantetheinyl transferase